MGVGLSVLFGVVFLAAAVGIATSGFVLTATPDSLTLETSGLLCATFCKIWKKQEIASIRADTKIDNNDNSDMPRIITTRVLIQPRRTQSSSSRTNSEWGSSLHQSKPEMEWIATTLRAVLGVPASDAPTGDALRAGSDDPRSRH